MAIYTRSAWEEAQLWRERRAAASQRFQDDAQVISDSLATAQSNLISETGNIVLHKAVARIQAATQAKAAKISTTA